VKSETTPLPLLVSKISSDMAALMISGLATTLFSSTIVESAVGCMR